MQFTTYTTLSDFGKVTAHVLEERVERARKQYNLALFINSNDLACFVLRFASCFTSVAADSRALCRTNEGNYRKWVRRVLETIGTVLVLSTHGKDVARSRPVDYYRLRGQLTVSDTLFIAVCNTQDSDILRFIFLSYKICTSGSCQLYQFASYWETLG